MSRAKMYFVHLSGILVYFAQLAHQKNKTHLQIFQSKVYALVAREGASYERIIT